FDRVLRLLLQERETLSLGAEETGDRERHETRAYHQEKTWRSRKPTARERAVGFGAIDAGDDGNDPQSWRERQVGGRPGEVDKQRALCLRRLSAVCADVFDRGDGDVQRRPRTSPARDEGAPRREGRHGRAGRGVEGADRGVQKNVSRQDRQALPGRSD